MRSIIINKNLHELIKHEEKIRNCKTDCSLYNICSIMLNTSTVNNKSLLCNSLIELYFVERMESYNNKLALQFWFENKGEITNLETKL